MIICSYEQLLKRGACTADQRKVRARRTCIKIKGDFNTPPPCTDLKFVLFPHIRTTTTTAIVI